MTPRYAYGLWRALPDPDLMPKPSSDPVELAALAF
jgi:hypothetical protein